MAATLTFHRKRIRRFFAYAQLLLIGTAVTITALTSGHAAALSGSNFQAGHIIDDAIFTNSNAMSVQDIQNFLNVKVGTCDVNGTQPSSHYDSAANRYYTDAEWGAINNNPAPFTCINLYVENTTTLQNNYSNPGAGISGGISAAQIIYNAAQAHQINPQVLLVVLQKEQGLTTDYWPWYGEYQHAMGYSCPDSSGCNGAYADFFKQVDSAAWQFRQYLNKPGAYNYWIGANNIRYNPNASCGSSVVNIQNAATAALYNYTPYQPNQAALNNLTGNGDSCSAYGNRNFWYYFNTWFGTSIVDVYPWAMEEAIGGDGRYWLVIGNTKRWIPNGTILNDWNLDQYPLQQVTQAELDAIPTLPNLGNLGVTSGGQYVFVDNRQRYAIPNGSQIANWGYANSTNVAVPLYSVLSTMPYEGVGVVNQFVQQTGSSAMYLMSGGVLHPIAPAYVSRWNIGTATAVSAANIAIMPQGATIQYQVNIGGNNFIADLGSLLRMDSAATAAYGSTVASNFVSIDPSTTSVFPLYLASNFVRPVGTVNCYALIGGKQYYILNGQIAGAWDIGGAAQNISSALLSGVTNGGVLGSVAQSTTDSSYYLVDGAAHQVAPSLANAYGAGSTPLTMDSSTLSTLAGTPLNTPIFRINGTANLYDMIGGKYYFISNGSILDGYGYPSRSSITNLNSSALSSVPFGGVLTQFVTNGGTTYYLQNGNAYPIASQYVTQWLGNTPALAYPGDDFAQRFNVQSTPLTNLVKDSSNNTWLVDGGSLMNVTPYADAYAVATPASLTVTDMPRSNLPVSYLVRSSTTPSDSRIWLINNGTKQWITNGTEFYGYNGVNVPATPLSDAELNAIPNASPASDPSLILYNAAYGFKLLVNGTFYGFPDGDTVTNVVGANPPLAVSTSVFSAISVQGGTVSRLIKDGATQQIYYMQGGQKHWITNGNAFRAYASNPLVTLPSSVVQWFPTGSPIN